MKIIEVNRGVSNNFCNQQNKSVSFGKLVNGVNYPDDLVYEANRLLAAGKEAKIENYRKDFMECWEDVKFQPIAWLLSPFAKLEGSFEPVKDVRIALGIATLGISELTKLPEATIRKIFAKKSAKKYVEQLKSCMFDLMKEKGLR